MNSEVSELQSSSLANQHAIAQLEKELKQTKLLTSTRRLARVFDERRFSPGAAHAERITWVGALVAFVLIGLARHRYAASSRSPP